MPKKPIIHKQNTKRRVYQYLGFGHHGSSPTPICRVSRDYSKKSVYHMHRNWKYVTCKSCIKKKPEVSV